MKKRLLLIVFALTLLFPINKVFADGYTIEKYDVDIKVKENNVLDIVETIDVNFEESRHGIYRKIPIHNKIYRSDGTSESNLAKITNIKVNDQNTISSDNGYRVIKIGDPDKLVSGKHSYTISYSYDLGKDRNKNYDELYFNIIGTEWDTIIDKVNFSIVMPKKFDKKNLGFSTGSKGSSGYNEEDLTYKVDGKTITGSYSKQLDAYEGITVRLELDEGYFKVEDRIDVFNILMFILPIVGVIIAFVLWQKYGKDNKPVETVEFYPPENLNSLDLAYAHKGKVTSNDVVSLLIYLANKGYIKVEEVDKKGLIGKKKTFQLTKLKDYEGKDTAEKTFLDGLFKSGDVVSEKDLKNEFYTTVSAITTIATNKNKSKIFEKMTSKVLLIVLMIILTGLLIVLKPLYDYLGCINISVSFLLEALSYSKICLYGFIVGLIGIALMIFFIIFMPKRTTYGVEILGKVKGFKTFLETAEKDKLEALVEQDPSYFYNILPYTYVLGVSSKWMKKFESITVEPPTWYYSSDPFTYMAFNHFMNDTMASARQVMTSRPNDNSFSGGGFSGGGFSGGGSGGGGGGSW